MHVWSMSDDCVSGCCKPDLSFVFVDSDLKGCCLHINLSLVESLSCMADENDSLVKFLGGHPSLGSFQLPPQPVQDTIYTLISF